MGFFAAFSKTKCDPGGFEIACSGMNAMLFQFPSLFYISKIKI
jgi:hypothetical protein